MRVRLLAATDAVDIVDMVYEVFGKAKYTKGVGELDPIVLSRVITNAITNPERTPCFVHDEDSGIGGMLYGDIVTTFFKDQKWFDERVFYIREEYRSLPLARAYIDAVTKWCRQHGVTRIEFGNGFTRDERMEKFYERLGYERVNTKYAKRI